MSMELQQVANYLNGKFLINNMKADKKDVLRGNLLKAYSVDSLGSSICEVSFYDTPDFFFASKGINIYTEFSTMGNLLIVRYDSTQVDRIEFLKDIPNFFQINIKKGETIHSYYEKINEAIYQVYPSGLGVNTEEYFRQSKPVVRITKKRDSYRVVNNTGLKMIINFETCSYSNTLNGHKYNQPVLDVYGESPKYKEDFDLFLKHVIRDHPQLLRLPDNELSNARTNLE